MNEDFNAIMGQYFTQSGGVDCSVSAAVGTVDYSFRGSCLEMKKDGHSIILVPIRRAGGGQGDVAQSQNVPGGTVPPPNYAAPVMPAMPAMPEMPKIPKAPQFPTEDPIDNN